MGYVLLAVVIGIALYVITMYNTLVARKNQIEKVS